MTGPVLVIAAHPDDEVLGCGGTMAKWASEGREVHVLLMADGEMSRPSATMQDCVNRKEAAQEAGLVLGCARVSRPWFADNRMDGDDILGVVKWIEEFVAEIKPTTVLTHHGGDVNVDHQVTHRAVVTACRPLPGQSVRELLYFEVPSSTEWQTPSTFAPTYFVDIADNVEAKLEALRCYRKELRDYPHPRSLRAIEALWRWRGATAGYEAAEAFMVGRVLA